MRRLTNILGATAGGLLAAGLLAGCGGDGLPNIDKGQCDDASGCDDAVTLSNRSFSVRCAVPDEGRLGERVGEAGSDGRFAEARAIEGEDPADFVALRTRGDGLDWCENRAYVIGVESTWAKDEDTRRVTCDEASVPDQDWCTP